MDKYFFVVDPDEDTALMGILMYIIIIIASHKERWAS